MDIDNRAKVSGEGIVRPADVESTIFQRFFSFKKRPDGGVKKNSDGSVLCKSARIINGDIIPGATHLSYVHYINPGLHDTPTHVHDVDEIVGFFGTDPDDVDNLNGVIRFYIDGEWAEFNQSCFIFIPAGVPHCPYEIVELSRPIAHISMLPTASYGRTS